MPKLEIKIGKIAFSGEGEEKWLTEQLDKVLTKYSEVAKIKKPNINGNVKTDTTKALSPVPLVKKPLDKIGIGTANPKSLLSIGGEGSPNTTSYVYTPKVPSNKIGFHSQLDGTGGFASVISAVFGHVKSGYGYTRGVVGVANNNTQSNNGRAYGLYGVGGNADVNFGVYATIVSKAPGRNIGGSAVLGHDGVTIPKWGGIVYGNWAGYFMGNTYFNNKVNIGNTKFPKKVGTINVDNFRLFVKGGILTEDIIIDANSNWADYVFHENYRLKSLDEVKAFIKKAGHLPNTPSAKEIKENGLHLVNTLVKQQEKIEELFLHCIALNKEKEALKSTISNMEKRLFAVEKAV